VSVPLDLADVKDVKQGLGGTINDVVLATCTGALRTLLKSRGEPLHRPLRAMVPVNLRGEEDERLGNKVTSLFVDLPIGEFDRHRRYEATRASAGALKSGSAALGASTLISATGVLPPVLHGAIAETLYSTRLCNLTITNVPGPQFALYAHGSRLRRIIPLVPLFRDHAIGIAIISYDGELVFGVNVDRASNPDVDVLERGLRDEFGALLTLARG
jgi:WS/DGAT/MGAT family acyltransferase